MKKSKLLIPLITIAGTAAMTAPVLTSCSQGEKEETHFQFTTAEKEKHAQSTVGFVDYTFRTEDTLSDEEVKAIQFIVIPKKTISTINWLRCYTRDVSSDKKIFTIQIDYSIDPSAFTEEGTTYEYDIKIHNGSWYQIETGFSIIAKQ